MKLLFNLGNCCSSRAPCLGEEASHDILSKQFDKWLSLCLQLLIERLRMRQNDCWHLASLTSCNILSSQTWKCTDLRKVRLTLLVCCLGRLCSSAANIHACCSALGRDIKLHFTNIDEWLCLRLSFFLSLCVSRLFLSADFIDLVHERVSK